MSKRTLLLILALLLLSGVLLVFALSPKQPVSQQREQGASAPPASRSELQGGQTAVVQTLLSMSPNPLTVSANTPFSVNVEIATGGNKVTAVQLEISFDPKVLTNVAIATPTTGAFFENPIELLKNVDEKTGTITFALGMPPTGEAKTGTGTVATLTFTPVGAVGTQSQLTILPKSLVTATGASSSVLKSISGTTVIVR